MKIISKGYIIAVAVTVIGLFSCTEKTIDTSDLDKTDAIIFNNVATKAGLSDIQDTENGGFGVWTYFSNNEVGNNILMENTKVTYDFSEKQWVYSPLKYWLKGFIYTFIATYPYYENGTYFTSDLQNKAIRLSVSETPSQVDYLIAKTETDTYAEDFDKIVSLQFNHLLSSVGFRIWRDGGKHQNDQMRIKKVIISNIRKSGVYSSVSDTWTPTDEKLSVVKTYDSFSETDNIGAAIINPDGSLDVGVSPANPFNDMMLIPQTLDASNLVSLKIEYQLKRNNAVSWEDCELETYLPSITWNASSRYTYNVVLSSVTDITIYYIQTKVDQWGTPQVGGTVIIK